MALPVIQLVGMKLGCISHALLTAEAIEKDGLQYAGTMANCLGIWTRRKSVDPSPAFAGRVAIV